MAAIDELNTAAARLGEDVAGVLVHVGKLAAGLTQLESQVPEELAPEVDALHEITNQIKTVLSDLPGGGTSTAPGA